MTKTALEICEEVAVNIDGKVRTDYSGRYMYGKTCIAIDCSDTEECVQECLARLVCIFVNLVET